MPKTFSLLTVDGQKKLYTNQQINDADKAKIFQANMGYIHENRLIKMIRLNKMINCEVTEENVRRSVNIYGKSINYLKGNSNARKGESIKFEGEPEILREFQKAQMLFMDIMQIGKQMSLVIVATPLEMKFVTHIKSKSEVDLGNAVINQISQIESKGFRVERILWDSEAAVRSEGLNARIRSKVKTLETLEPGRHVARLERKIQSIKKMFRSIKAGTIFNWDSNTDNLCIQYCVQRWHHMSVDNGPSDTSPWEGMTGKRPDAKYDYRRQFGQYVQYLENDTTNNTSDPRTHGALALFPAGSNIWYYRRLSDGKVRRRGRAIEMPISAEIISYINDRAESNRGPLMPRFSLGNLIDVNDQRDDDIYDNEPVLLNQTMIEPTAANELAYHDDMKMYIYVEEEEENEDVDKTNLVNDYTAETEEIVLPLHIAGESYIKNKKEDRDQQAKIHVVAIHRKGSRVREARPKLRYLYANMTVKEAVEDQGDSAIKEIIREMTSIHIDRKGFEAVFEKNITGEQRIRVITSKMFLKNKYFADGKYEKK